jgi:hypothetical protein
MVGAIQERTWIDRGDNLNFMEVEPAPFCLVLTDS